MLDLLEEKGLLACGLNVKTIGMLTDMEVVGYVPIYDSPGMILDIRKDYAAGATNVRFEVYDENAPARTFNGVVKRNYVYLPIANKVGHKAECEVTPFIRLCGHRGNNALYYYQRFIGTTADWKKHLDELLKSEEFYLNKEHRLMYKLRNGEFVFSRRRNVVGVSDSFVCLCSYVNSVTGVLECAMISPDSLLAVLPKKDDQSVSY